MAQLVAEEIHYRFGRQRVLDGVSLTVAPGECVVLFGANGSGKSTLLSLFSTRLRLQQGRYQLNGLNVPEHGEEVRGQLLFVGHATHLYGHLTPVENLRFYADLHGVTATEPRLREMVATVGLARFQDRVVHGFSAGMRKRLALARMLLNEPSLVLLDEPHSALDAEGMRWLNQLLSDYLNRGGSVVMASHDPERLTTLPHRGAYLRNGRLSGAASC